MTSNELRVAVVMAETIKVSSTFARQSQESVAIGEAASKFEPIDKRGWNQSTK